MGQGGGMGQGMMGGGFQTPYGMGTSPGASPQMPKNQELQFLKNQAQTLKEQLGQIDKRIKELKKNS